MDLLGFFQNISNEVYVFFVSMLPILELRAAIPIGVALGMNIFECYALSVFGNMLPIPFILIFIKKILEYMSNSKINFFNKVSNYLIGKAEKRSDKVDKYSNLGLFLFVAIPVPGTGAWTGALIAALMGMRFKRSLPSIFFGVLTAGIIMTLASYGVLSFLSFLA